jgi:hypothetical protein
LIISHLSSVSKLSRIFTALLIHLRDAFLNLLSGGKCISIETLSQLNFDRKEQSSVVSVKEFIKDISKVWVIN